MLPSERTAYIVCRVEDKDRSIFVLVVPELDADWIADGMRKIPETFNAVTVIKKPSRRVVRPVQSNSGTS